MKPEKTRQMSLQQLRAIRDVENIDAGHYIKNEIDDHYLSLRDPNSTFYFLIKEIGVDGNGKVHYGIEYSPASHSTSAPAALSIGADEYSTFFGKWDKLVQEYNEHLTSSDTISEQYKEEFFADFELIDDDAATNSFPLKTQLLLDSYLTKVVEDLEKLKDEEGVSESTKGYVNEAIDTAKDLQDTQTRLTKKEVVGKLATLYAQFRKIGLKVLELGGTEVIKSIVKSALDDPHKFLDGIKGLLH